MISNIKPIIPVNPNEIVRKGEEIYQKELKEKLEKNYLGKFVAIEVESKEYFLGETSVEASQKARKKYPDKVTYLMKVGYPAVFTMSNHFKDSFYETIF